MICIVICTRERPIMLRRLLNSCVNIKPDIRSTLKFIIVENGTVGKTSDIVSEFSQYIDIAFVSEKNIGIVNARNAGVDAFLKTSAAWMATIDDDETISENWLAAMLNAIERFPECKVFAGPHFRQLPKGAGIWLASKPKPNPETGTVTHNVSTANALFSRGVFDVTKIGLRFNDKFNLSGGSDTHLFYQLRDMNEDVVWVQEAECYEPMVISRTHLSSRIKVHIQVGQNWGRSYILRFGLLRGGPKIFLDALMFLINFVTFGVAGGVVWSFNRIVGENLLNKSLSLGCYSLGYFKALTAKQGDLYRDIDGE